MRQAFMIGAIVLWVAINFIGSFVEMAAPLSGYDSKLGKSDIEIMDSASKPEMTDMNVATIFSKIRDTLVLLGKFISLWHDSLWQGTLLYVYYFIILPIGISFWVVLVMALRGTGSS